jgi:hypothetical protein
MLYIHTQRRGVLDLMLHSATQWFHPRCRFHCLIETPEGFNDVNSNCSFPARDEKGLNENTQD